MTSTVGDVTPPAQPLNSTVRGGASLVLVAGEYGGGVAVLAEATESGPAGRIRRDPASARREASP
jgi:hypothetical protein